MKKSIIVKPFIILLIITGSACRKKNKEVEEPIKEEPTVVAYDNYSGFKVGNYWVYERFKTDSNGVTTSLNIFDSCYVERDTMIGSEKAFIVYRPDPIGNANRRIWKDSLHYIVSSGIRFTYQDFTTEFINRYSISPPTDTIYQYIKKMDEKNLLITVPAGTFVTSSMNEVYQFFYPYYPATYYKVRIQRTRFAKNVGIVTETLPSFSSQLFSVERRLVRYKVN